MTVRSAFFDSAILDYLRAHGTRETSTLLNLRLATEALPQGQMMSSPEQCQFLAFLIEILAPQTLIEIGVFTGYATLWMAEAMPKTANLFALEKDAAKIAVGQPFWQAAGVADRIEVMLGPALKSLDKFAPGSIDFMYVDADKKNYLAYYERALELLSARGVLVVDNTLWYGRLADPLSQDATTQSLRVFNTFLHEDSRITLSMLPIGDGLTLVRRR